MGTYIVVWIIMICLCILEYNIDYIKWGGIA